MAAACSFDPAARSSEALRPAPCGPDVRAPRVGPMSAALLVCASVALLLLGLLGLSLAWLARVERKAGDGLADSAAAVPQRKGESSDVQLVVAFPESTRSTVFSQDGDLAPAELPALADALRGALPEAREVVAEYGQFRPIPMRFSEGLVAVCLHVRVRSPLPVVAVATRPEVSALLDALVDRVPEGVIAVRIGRTPATRDPAAPALVRLDPAAAGQ